MDRRELPPGRSGSPNCQPARKITYLNDKQPLPPGIAELAVELEDASSDEARECGSEDVASVQDGDSSCDLCPSVEVGNDQESARVYCQREHTASLQYGASTTPKKKRVTSRPVKLREKAVQIDIAAHNIMIPHKKRLGLTRAVTSAYILRSGKYISLGIPKMTRSSDKMGFWGPLSDEWEMTCCWDRHGGSNLLKSILLGTPKIT